MSNLNIMSGTVCRKIKDTFRVGLWLQHEGNCLSKQIDNSGIDFRHLTYLSFWRTHHITCYKVKDTERNRKR